MNKKLAVITGAGSGLGSSLARRFSDLGFHVALLGRNEDKLNKVAETLQSNQYSVHSVDVSDFAAVEATFKDINDKYGDVDVLVNNAGTGAFKLLEDISADEINSMIDVNIKGTIYCTQQVLPSMKKNNDGVIANIVSTAGLVGKLNETVYCASKFGARGFTEALLVELKDTDIRVFGAYMGGMKTEFWDGILKEDQMTHLMDPEDIAEIIMANVKERKNLTVEQVVIKNH
ncbi:SDR family oxidoreductase [Phocicoccus pinnipedialis]|uniref:3-oxoacyl-[acyl-carrier-protein] reductase FabG n=1 Tax=Phocicoccus pinnipedialis TaxID=110845 RepID=A0A6V7R5M3_9BACL|nr:SDR family oxidoreductase [Jeotgalicoccus pinnipedialis]MBP1939761.1 short-subunit dehydrogenase [Jeotgalicoccus pinnipedialis]CAD2072383.1 3-oxoacyl-[acyl-carrier-protein] reductase FabG [Jeotgalicoccus pinnipedialis]